MCVWHDSWFIHINRVCRVTHLWMSHKSSNTHMNESWVMSHTHEWIFTTDWRPLRSCVTWLVGISFICEWVCPTWMIMSHTHAWILTVVTDWRPLRSCGTWLVGMPSICEWVCPTWRIHSYECEWFIHMKDRLIHIWMTDELIFICEWVCPTWMIHPYGIHTLLILGARWGHAWHALCIFHSHVNNSFIFVTWRIRLYNMTHS